MSTGKLQNVDLSCRTVAFWSWKIVDNCSSPSPGFVKEIYNSINMYMCIWLYTGRF